MFNGAEPSVAVLRSEEEETGTVADWLSKLTDGGLEPDEISVFVRSPEQLERARSVLESTGLPYVVLDSRVQTRAGQVAVSTMHLAKGLEFRAVAVMACDDEVVPRQERIETVVDDSDLEDVYNTERHLLYVACTRGARPSAGVGRRAGLGVSG